MAQRVGGYSSAAPSPPATTQLGSQAPGFVGQFKTKTMASNDPNEQESDMMERLPTKQVEADEKADKIPVVSLGCSCAPKLSFKEMGRGSETLPFDWVRTTLDGLIHFLATDFENYFEYTMDKEIQPPPGSTKKMHMFRSPRHSFWHDDPRQPAMVERYKRRIVRFNSINAHTQPVLFVRTAACSDEVRYASYLVSILRQRFGPMASLLMIVDFQGPEAPNNTPAAGVVAVKSEPNLMLNFFPTKTSSAPHAGAIRTALDWLTGRGVRAVSVAHPEDAMAFVKFTDWGLQGTSGVLAFEGVQVAADSVKMCRAMTAPPSIRVMPAREGEQPSDSLEKMAQPIQLELGAARMAFPVVSLGSSVTPKVALKAMDIGKTPYPFDWIRVSLKGLVHYIGNDFKDFFEYTTNKDVYLPELKQTYTMYRSQWHSFWYDDPRHMGMRETYLGRIRNFNALNAREAPVIFVRAVATTDELKHARTLMKLLIDKFGVMATLLIIVDFQGPEAPGACVIKGEPNVMVYYMKTTQASSAPYCEPIATALAWVAGQGVSARALPNFDSIGAIIEDHSQLGMGGVPIFEPSSEDGDWQIEVAVVHRSENDWKTESELMENIPARIMEADKLRDGIPLVSLGCSCGPKLSFKDIGRGSETLPFDWVRTRVAGVINLISTNFEDFYKTSTRQECYAPGDEHPMIMFRGRDHSFWHDDPTDAAMKDRYDRRIERFGRVGSQAEQQWVLFVRSAAESNELRRAGELSKLLVQKFGKHAVLLFIVDFQGDGALGACVVHDHPNLMIYFNDTVKCNSAAPYGKAITTAMDWILGRSIAAGQCPTLQDGVNMVKHTDWGMYGQGGVVAFDSAILDDQTTTIR